MAISFLCLRFACEQKTPVNFAGCWRYASSEQLLEFCMLRLWATPNSLYIGIAFKSSKSGSVASVGLSVFQLLGTNACKSHVQIHSEVEVSLLLSSTSLQSSRCENQTWKYINQKGEAACSKSWRGLGLWRTSAQQCASSPPPSWLKPWNPRNFKMATQYQQTCTCILYCSDSEKVHTKVCLFRSGASPSKTKTGRIRKNSNLQSRLKRVRRWAFCIVLPWRSLTPFIAWFNQILIS